MQNLKFLKSAVNLLTGFGVSKILSDIVANNVASKTVLDKTTVFTAQIVLALIVSDVTQKYTDAKIDKFANWIEETKLTLANQ